MKNSLLTVMILATALTLVLVASGCPKLDPLGHVTVLMSADLEAGEKLLLPKLGAVDVGEIESLVVTLTEISLDRSSDPPADGPDASSEIIVFSGAVDIELLDLLGISEIITTDEVPAGHYTKVRLSIENPRMILVAEPDEVITDIQTTASGRLFVSTPFFVPEEQDSLILLDFQGLHLVETGAGKFVWTPQLRALVSVEPAAVLVEGDIESVDTGAETLLLLLDSGELVLVHYGEADIILPDDTAGTADDLEEDGRVVISGVLDVSGVVTAEVIWIL